MDKIRRRTKKTTIAILGSIVVLLGLVMVPYPGPGWLVVFAGLAVLATEFDWAHSILQRARGYYDAWMNWLARQIFVVRAFFWMLTFAIVVVTIWLVDGYGLINGWLNLGIPWLESPLF